MKQVNTRYYAEQIAQRYPELDPEQVQQLCRQFMKELYQAVALRHYDVAIRDTPRDLKVKFYKRQFDVKKVNGVARVKAARLKKYRTERAERLAMQKHFKPS